VTTPANPSTSLSLLKKLKVQPTDEHAWREFIERYGAKILGWCRSWGLQDADAADVTQTVLLRLARNIQRYDEHRGSFRAWLKTVSHHAWYDLIKTRGHQVIKGGEAMERRLNSEHARDDLTRQLESAWDEELLELASDRVRLRVHPNTWKAFELVAMESVPGQEAADRLGLRISSVYRARSVVLKMLREEAQSLEQSEFA
jgi:RNA polymerase sigma factor (sigma-70 family)